MKSVKVLAAPDFRVNHQENIFMKSDNQFYWELRRNIQEFEKLDSDLLNQIQNGNFDYIEIVINAKKEIKRLLSDKDFIHIGPDKKLSEKLRKIRDDYGYSIDGILSRINEITGQDISQSSEEDKDYVDALFSEGTADYVDDNFFKRKNEVGAIVVSSSLPDVFLHHLGKLKECYSLGLYEATVVYCRAVLESGLYGSFKRNVRRGPKEKDFEEWNLKSLINSMKRFLSHDSYVQAHSLREKANNILHWKHEKIVISEREALDAIKATFGIIEEMYLQ